MYVVLSIFIPVHFPCMFSAFKLCGYFISDIFIWEHCLCYTFSTHLHIYFFLEVHRMKHCFAGFCFAFLLSTSNVWSPIYLLFSINFTLHFVHILLQLGTAPLPHMRKESAIMPQRSSPKNKCKEAFLATKQITVLEHPAYSPQWLFSVPEDKGNIETKAFWWHCWYQE